MICAETLVAVNEKQLHDLSSIALKYFSIFYTMPSFRIPEVK
jgi:hypothetical protein